VFVGLLDTEEDLWWLSCCTVELFALSLLLVPPPVPPFSLPRESERALRFGFPFLVGVMDRCLPAEEAEEAEDPA